MKDRVLSYDCSHIRSPGAPGDPQDTEPINCAICGAKCKNELGLRNPKMMVHVILDPRREAAGSAGKCPACLCEFPMAYGIQYRKVHFQQAKCVEPKAELTDQGVFFGQDISDDFLHNLPSMPFPVALGRPQGVGSFEGKEVAARILHSLYYCYPLRGTAEQRIRRVK